MAGPFTIIPSSNRIALDAAGQGTVTFTATNTARMRLRSTARLVASPPDAAPWLTIVPPDGQADAFLRPFAPEGTQSYAVRVVVPPGAAAGEYRVRLVVANEANPDDEFTESVDVGFTVAQASPPPPPPKFPMWLIPVIVVLVLLVGAAAFLLNRPGDDPPTDVPTVGTNPIDDLLRARPPSDGVAEIQDDLFLGDSTVSLLTSRGTLISLAPVDVTGFTDSFGQECGGQVSQTPAFAVVIFEVPANKLLFFTNSDLTNSTLIMRDPNGQFYCSGDGSERRAQVQMDKVVEGEYFFWVGSQATDRRPRRLFPVELFVTQP